MIKDLKNNYGHLLSLFANADDNVIHGRLKLQKIVYILQDKGFPFPEFFRYGDFGPFSSELAEEVSYLAKIDVFEEEIVSTKSDKKYYKYLANKKAIQELSMKELTKDEDFISLTKQLLEKESQELEVIATIIYLLRNSGFTKKELPKVLVTLKPHFTEDQVKKIYIKNRHLINAR